MRPCYLTLSISTSFTPTPLAHSCPRERHVARASLDPLNRLEPRIPACPAMDTITVTPKSAGPPANAKITKGKLLTGTSNLPQILYGCGESCCNFSGQPPSPSAVCSWLLGG